MCTEQLPSPILHPESFIRQLGLTIEFQKYQSVVRTKELRTANKIVRFLRDHNYYVFTSLQPDNIAIAWNLPG